MVSLKSLDEKIFIKIQEGESLLIGRIPECDIIVDDPSISSQHAKLKLADDCLQMVDLQSTNGTRLNYSIVNDPEYLQDGDTVEFGNVTFIVDGPHLKVPEKKGNTHPAMTSLEPIEVAGDLHDTMRTPELSAAQMNEQAAPKSEDVQDPAAEEVGVSRTLTLYLAFFIGLVLLLSGGALLLMSIWNTSPTQ